jgi:hypothetical protein
MFERGVAERRSGLRIPHFVYEHGGMSESGRSAYYLIHLMKSIDHIISYVQSLLRLSDLT